MRYLNMAVLAGVTVFAAGCQSSHQSEDTAKILSELKNINTRLDKIDAAMKKNEESVSVSHSNGFVTKRAKQEVLDKIKLPPSASRDDVKKYIRAIQTASKDQNSFSDTDPQVEMYMQVGEKNLDLLLDASRENINNHHIVRAINLMPITNISKDMLIKGLRSNPQIITVIIREGWEKDAKSTIKDILLYPRGYVPQEAIQAAASFRDPDMNDALLHYFINGQNRANTYRIIKMIPEIKIDDETIEKVWNQAIMSHDYERNAMAAIAVGYGHKNALEALLDRNMTTNYGPDYSFNCDNAVRQAVDCTGSITDIKKWYEANRNNIVFDKTDKKFKVKKADAPITPPATKQ